MEERSSWTDPRRANVRSKAVDQLEGNNVSGPQYSGGIPTPCQHQHQHRPSHGHSRTRSLSGGGGDDFHYGKGSRDEKIFDGEVHANTYRPGHSRTRRSDIPIPKRRSLRHALGHSISSSEDPSSGPSQSTDSSDPNASTSTSDRSEPTNPSASSSTSRHSVSISKDSYISIMSHLQPGTGRIARPAPAPPSSVSSSSMSSSSSSSSSSSTSSAASTSRSPLFSPPPSSSSRSHRFSSSNSTGVSSDGQVDDESGLGFKEGDDGVHTRSRDNKGKGKERVGGGGIVTRHAYRASMASLLESEAEEGDSSREESRTGFSSDGVGQRDAVPGQHLDLTERERSEPQLPLGGPLGSSWLYSSALQSDLPDLPQPSSNRRDEGSPDRPPTPSSPPDVLDILINRTSYLLEISHSILSSTLSCRSQMSQLLSIEQNLGWSVESQERELRRRLELGTEMEGWAREMERESLVFERRLRLGEVGERFRPGILTKMGSAKGEGGNVVAGSRAKTVYVNAEAEGLGFGYGLDFGVDLKRKEGVGAGTGNGSGEVGEASASASVKGDNIRWSKTSESNLEGAAGEGEDGDGVERKRVTSSSSSSAGQGVLPKTNALHSRRRSIDHLRAVSSPHRHLPHTHSKSQSQLDIPKTDSHASEPASAASASERRPGPGAVKFQRTVSTPMYIGSSNDRHSGARRPTEENASDSRPTSPNYLSSSNPGTGSRFLNPFNHLTSLFGSSPSPHPETNGEEGGGSLNTTTPAPTPPPPPVKHAKDLLEAFQAKTSLLEQQQQQQQQKLDLNPNQGGSPVTGPTTPKRPTHRRTSYSTSVIVHTLSSSPSGAAEGPGPNTSRSLFLTFGGGGAGTKTKTGIGIGSGSDAREREGKDGGEGKTAGVGAGGSESERVRRRKSWSGSYGRSELHLRPEVRKGAVEALMDAIGSDLVTGGGGEREVGGRGVYGLEGKEEDGREEMAKTEVAVAEVEVDARGFGTKIFETIAEEEGSGGEGTGLTPETEDEGELLDTLDTPEKRDVDESIGSTRHGFDIPVLMAAAIDESVVSDPWNATELPSSSTAAPRPSTRASKFLKPHLSIIPASLSISSSNPNSASLLTPGLPTSSSSSSFSSDPISPRPPQPLTPTSTTLSLSTVSGIASNHPHQGEGVGVGEDANSATPSPSFGAHQRTVSSAASSLASINLGRPGEPKSSDARSSVPSAQTTSPKGANAGRKPRVTGASKMEATRSEGGFSGSAGGLGMGRRLSSSGWGWGWRGGDGGFG